MHTDMIHPDRARYRLFISLPVRDTPCMSKRIDFSVLRKIPIEHVCNALGIPLKRTGSGVWNVENKDDPKGYTSLTIFESSNRWKRFSSGEGGGTIDLVMEWKQCDLQSAAEFLTTHFPSHR